MAKTTLQIQFGANSVEPHAIEKAVKEDIKAQGIKLVSIETINIYYKPEENAIYYTTVAKDGTQYASDAIAVPAE